MSQLCLALPAAPGLLHQSVLLALVRLLAFRCHPSSQQCLCQSGTVIRTSISLVQRLLLVDTDSVALVFLAEDRLVRSGLERRLACRSRWR